MKTTFAIAAVAGFAAAASAQSIYITASNDLPADGEVVTLDVVLDATDLSSAFYAWHQYNFNVDMAADGTNSALAGAVNTTEDVFQLAVTESPLGTFAPTLNAPARAWESGRRPGAFFPGNGSTAGGNQFGPGSADLVTDGSISSTAGSIGGRQAADANGVPETNGFIHIGRVYEAFRFTFTYSEDMGIVTFTPADVVLNVYGAQGAANDFVDASSISGVSIGIPTPASAALLGLGGLAAARRRRA